MTDKTNSNAAQGIDMSSLRHPESSDESTEATVPDWLIPGRLYDVLKWVGLVILPALAVFVGTVGPAWGMPHVDEIVTTLNALAVLDGMLIGASAIKAKLALAA